jgi:hypothetical protein
MNVGGVSDRSWNFVKRILSSTLLFVVFGPGGALGQAPGFSGTWILDQERSRVSTEATLAGLVGAGAPETLHVTQPSNGWLVVESQVNESYARLYTPGGETSTPVFLGEAGHIRMTSRWEGRTLVAEGTRESPNGKSTAVKEVFGLSDDGRTLEVEIRISDAGESVSKLRYKRTQDVGPCESWPSPCKEPSRPDP